MGAVEEMMCVVCPTRMFVPLNSYVYIHWILDLKYILLLLQRGHSGDGCDLASTLCRYDLRKCVYFFWVGKGCDE